LTGLPNLRLFDTALAGSLENLVRYGWPFGFLIADVDFFKRINDECGHAYGDAALRGVAATLQNATRAGDVLARWGGEEFAGLVEASDRAGLVETAERLRVLVARSEVRLGELTRTVHVSVGGTLATPEDTAESLFARADAALYAAKKGGRNRVEIAE
jgi:diguanylate cyclase (GGDEF)-like protein